MISVRDLMDCLEEYYDENHPELLLPEFQGSFFNFMNESEFSEYLEERYGFKIVEEVVIRNFILRTDVYGEPL